MNEKDFVNFDIAVKLKEKDLAYLSISITEPTMKRKISITQLSVNL